jgi:glycosyltransferase involved in cell wall biosynthesis
VNILHIISSVNPAGGGPIEAANQFGLAMAANGHHSEIASLDCPDAPFVKESPLRVNAMGPGYSKYQFSRRLAPWLAANRSKYDVAVVHGIWQFHSFGAWRAFHNSRTPYFVYMHGMLDPWFKTRYPLKHLTKWMFWPWSDYRVLRDAQAVLFTCEEERTLARSSFWLYRCNEKIVSYGITGPVGNPETDLQGFFTRYPDLRGKKLVLFISRIHPKKGCDLLIEAFAKVLAPHPDWHLVIAGPDQVGLRKELIQLAERLGVSSRITWTGMLRGHLKWGAIRAAEVFALPSHQENFGIVVAESLAAKVPVLISNKVNIWREVEADGVGIVGEDTLEGTCKMLRSYLETPEEKKLAMRRSARICFEKRFEVRKATDILQDVLLSATKANHLVRRMRSSNLLPEASGTLSDPQSSQSV